MCINYRWLFKCNGGPVCGILWKHKGGRHGRCILFTNFLIIHYLFIKNAFYLHILLSVDIIIWKKIIAVVDATFAIAKRKPENFSGFLLTTTKVLLSYNSSLRSFRIWFSYIHNFTMHPFMGLSAGNCSSQTLGTDRCSYVVYQAMRRSSRLRYFHFPMQ